MKKNIIAFGASNSRHSINKKLAIYGAAELQGIEVEVLDLNDYELPLYSVDLQAESGIPDLAKAFLHKIQSSDGIVISVAEYNGLHTTAFKNLWDWMSRIEGQSIWKGKPMLLLSAATTRREYNYVLKVSKDLFPAFGANIIADFYLPSFNHFFKNGEIIEESYRQKFEIAIAKFQKFLDLS